MRLFQFNLGKPYSYYLGHLPGSLSATLPSSEFLACMDMQNKKRKKKNYDGVLRLLHGSHLGLDEVYIVQIFQFCVFCFLRGP